MDPQAPAQPSIDTSYKHPSNPSDQNPAERSQAESTTESLSRSDATTEKRKAGDVSSGTGTQDEATPSSLAIGGQGEGDKNVGPPASNTEGEQMRAAGDGDIAKAQETKTGFGEQSSLASDMDRKREEQDEVKEERRATGIPRGLTGDQPGEGLREEDRGVDVKSALGGGSNIVEAPSGSGAKGVA
ncbi:MAG: hypothetical protein Q9195_008212 [Heterodermia aff. obscurata]